MTDLDDRNILDDPDSWLHGTAYAVLILFPIILFIVGGWNLYLAHEVGNRTDQSLPDLFTGWREGLDITRLYSQSHLMAARRFSNAVWQLSSAFITSGAALVLIWKKTVKKDKNKTANKTGV